MQWRATNTKIMKIRGNSIKLDGKIVKSLKLIIQKFTSTSDTED